MNHLDLLHDLASGSGDVDPAEARSIVNGAEEKLAELKEKARERFPDEADTPETGHRRKSKSEYSRQERADQYQQWREQGKDPNEEWAKLPE